MFGSWKLIIILSLGFDFLIASSQSSSPITDDTRSADLRAMVAREIKVFLDELGRGSFNFSDKELSLDKDNPEQKAIMISLIGRQFAAEKLLKSGESLQAFKVYANLFHETKKQQYLAQMIDIARSHDLIKQAEDVYALSGLILMHSKPPSLPKVTLNKLFERSYYDDLPLKTLLTNVQNLSAAVHHTSTAIYHRSSENYCKIYKESLWENFSLLFLEDSPYLTRKICLLYPNNAKHKLHLACLIQNKLVDLNFNNNQIASPEERNAIVEKLFREVNNSEAILSLGKMIKDKDSNIDLHKKVITSDNQRNEAVAECYRHAAAIDEYGSSAHLAQRLLVKMILSKQTDFDEKNIKQLLKKPHVMNIKLLR